MMPPDDHPRLTTDAFLGCLWAGLALSTISTVMRVAIRWRAFRSLYLDDLLVIIAWAMALVTAILWQTQASAATLQFELGTQMMAKVAEMPGPKEPLDPHRIAALLGPAVSTIESMWRSFVAILILYNTALYTIKASCLAFFWQLQYRSGLRHTWWWVLVSLFTLASYVATIGIQPYRCWIGGIAYTTTTCIEGPAADRTHAGVVFQTVADIATDLLLISIPVFLVWNVQIPRRQKATLIGMFSLTIVVVVSAIGRLIAIVANNDPFNGLDMTWLCFWYNLEVAVAMIISGLATFRQLLIMRKHQSEHRRILNMTWFGRKPATRLHSDPARYDAFHQAHGSTALARASKHPAQELIDDIIPLNAIQVTRDVNVYSMPRTSGATSSQELATSPWA